MKLFKLLPIAGLALTFATSSAFAEVGKDTSTEAEHMCQRVVAALIKKDGKSVQPAPAATPDSSKSAPANTTAM